MSTQRKLSSSVSALPSPELLERLVYVSSLSPSPENNQPWRFKVDSGKLFLFYRSEKSLPSDPSHTLNVLSLGAAIENLKLAASAEGFKAEVRYLEPESLSLPLAEITFVSDEPQSEPNYHTVFHRHTDRSFYFKRSLPLSFVGELRKIICSDRVSFCYTEDRPSIDEFAKLGSLSETIRFFKKESHQELFRNIHFSLKSTLSSREGIYFKDLRLGFIDLYLFYFLRFWKLVSFLGPLGLKKLYYFKTKRMIQASGAVFSVNAKSSSYADMMEAGQLFQRLWLMANRLGLKFQPLGAPSVIFPHCEKPIQKDYISRIRKIFPAMNLDHTPVIYFRVGENENKTLPFRVRNSIETILDKSQAEGRGFDHKRAFVRSIGLVTEEEAQLLKQKTIAVPGLGGVGGIHLATLARMGIGGFHIADKDTFSESNLNRQFAAFSSTLGKSKASSVSKMLLDINPTLRLKVWDEFITEKNVEAFLHGVDLMVDGLDAFALNERRLIFSVAQKKNIPIITAGPIGFSCAMLVFTPNSMSFDEYMAFQETDKFSEKFAKFIIGLTPRPYFLKYMDTSKSDYSQKTGPSSAAATDLCAGFASVTALKILLNRGKVYPVPYFHYYDAYLLKFKTGFTPLGNRNPFQKLIIHFLAKINKAKLSD